MGNTWFQLLLLDIPKDFLKSFEITPTNTNVTLKTIELVPVAKNLAGVTVDS